MESSPSDKKKKIVDIAGYSDHTYFLFEVKYNRLGYREAWDDATESLKAHLYRNKEERKPLNILVAGITFDNDEEKRCFSL